MDPRRTLPSLHPVSARGAEVALREVEPSDAEAAFRWGGDEEWFRYLPFEPVRSMEEERAFVATLVRVASARPRTDYHLAVVLAETDEMVGLVDLRITSIRHRVAELGFGIRRDLWGRGLGTEAARLMVDFGFRRLGLHRISAGHHPENLGSARVLERLGMTHEGRLRANLFAHGHWRDSVIYGVLEEEWPKDGSDGTA